MNYLTLECDMNDKIDFMHDEWLVHLLFIQIVLVIFDR